MSENAWTSRSWAPLKHAYAGPAGPRRPYGWKRIVARALCGGYLLAELPEVFSPDDERVCGACARKWRQLQSSAGGAGVTAGHGRV